MKNSSFYMLGVLLFLTACHKDDDNNSQATPTITYQLLRVDGNNNTSGDFSYQFSYNADDALSKVLYINTEGEANTFTYTYSNNNITMDNGDYSYTTTLNDAGHPIKLYREEDGVTSVTDFIYENDVLTKSYYEYNSSGFLSATQYEWQNGNMVKLSNEEYELSLTYDTEAQLQPGDLIVLEELIEYGTPIIFRDNVNLTKTTNSGIHTYQYTFDEFGRIAMLEIIENDTVETTLNYTYTTPN